MAKIKVKGKLVLEVRRVKCCFNVKEAEAKGSHGRGLGMPLVALVIEIMGFRIRAGFRL